MKNLIPLAMLAAAAVPMAAAPAQDAGHYAKNSAATYVTKAGSMDNYEQEASKLVLQTAVNPDVRAFAQKMVSDHAKTTADLMAAAKAASLGNPGNVLSEQAAMLDQLRATPKDRMEVAYLDQQVIAHEQALALHQGYATHGDNPGLKAVAASTLPVIQQLLDEVRRIRSAMGGGGR